MQSANPYLSIVVTTRNDDHGGSLMRRTQTFVNCLLGQCRRHNLPAELIIVEWNPPADRPPLADALEWPEEGSGCQVRIITVPPEIHHGRYQYGDALPLYQMIGKNVGIRRALGEFVLATNIDILLSDELMSHLAGQKLKKGNLYRIDRHDVSSDVPVQAPVEEQLDYCKRNRIRINSREGTFPLTADGLLTLSQADIVTPESELHLGGGWYEPESDGRRRLRWIRSEAEIIVRARGKGRNVLHIQVEPPENVANCRIALLDGRRVRIGEAVVHRAAPVQFVLSRETGSQETYYLKAEGEGFRTPADPRPRNLKVFWLGWAHSTSLAHMLVPARTGLRAKWNELRLRALRGLPFRVPFSSYSTGLIRELYRDEYGIVMALPPIWKGRDSDSAYAGLQAALDRKTRRLVSPQHLHTNGCGDFTLLHRDHWADLRGYPELDVFSMNVDSLFCWEAFYAGIKEEILPEPMRIYHIEHGTGSGWTPEGEAKLYERLAAKSVRWLDYQTVLEMAQSMSMQQAPMIFNLGNWGLADDNLVEVRPVPETANHPGSQPLESGSARSPK